MTAGRQDGIESPAASFAGGGGAHALDEFTELRWVSLADGPRSYPFLDAARVAGEPDQ